MIFFFSLFVSFSTFALGDEYQSLAEDFERAKKPVLNEVLGYFSGRCFDNKGRKYPSFLMFYHDEVSLGPKFPRLRLRSFVKAFAGTDLDHFDRPWWAYEISDQKRYLQLSSQSTVVENDSEYLGNAGYVFERLRVDGTSLILQQREFEAMMYCYYFFEVWRQKP